jgi:membrane associated rhomboid family serine protease/Flp pilus assembly protein TadD
MSQLHTAFNAPVDNAKREALEPATPRTSFLNISSVPIVTPTLIFLCMVVYGAMAVIKTPHPAAALQPILVWGANFGPLTLGGQWWRLVTSIFVHFGLIHLAVNMWCLWDLGSFAERLYGRATLLLIFFASGVAGAMWSLVWHPMSIEAGASGAIFGIAGALIASFLLGNHPFPRSAMKAALFSVLAFAGYNLFVGIFGSGAGNAAHVGGLVCGLGIGALVAVISHRWITVVLSVMSVVLGYGLLLRADGYIVPAQRGREALAAGQVNAAIQNLQESVRRKPSFAEGYLLLGQAYLRGQQYSEAEKTYRKALALDPAANDALYQLGTSLLAQARGQEALAIFEELAQKNPADAAGQVALATAAELAGDHALSLQAFQKASRLDPANPQVYAGMGFAALQLNQPEVAIGAFTKWCDIQPENANAFLNLAVAFKAKGMEREAQEAYANALKLSQK